MEYDIIIIGAGISGIGMAMELKRRFPSKRLAILEGRSNLGGTWDLFKYPGVRSDSSMSTLAFSRHPWSNFHLMANGGDILQYLNKVIKHEKLTDCIIYNQKVSGADFISNEQMWNVSTSSGSSYKTNFLIIAAGYYNYNKVFEAQFANKEAYKGDILHPQFWPKDFSVQGKTISVIGSGATAVTLAPSLLNEGAAQVNVLQRSPSYFLNVPRHSTSMWWLRMFSERLWWFALRVKDICVPYAFYLACRYFPNFMGPLLIKDMLKECGSTVDNDKNHLYKHFIPWYKPWEQRVCVDADGEFSKGVRDGRIIMHTGIVRQFCVEGVEFVDRVPSKINYLQKDGNNVDDSSKTAYSITSDAIVTATGLEVAPLALIPISIDGTAVVVNEKMIYKGVMFVGVPNFISVMGYLNASWTLKVDLIAKYTTRLLQLMYKKGFKSAIPSFLPGEIVKPIDFVDFNSGYLMRAAHLLPQQGMSHPFQSHHSWFADWIDLTWKRVDEKHLRLLKEGEIYIEKIVGKINETNECPLKVETNPMNRLLSLETSLNEIESGNISTE